MRRATLFLTTTTIAALALLSGCVGAFNSPRFTLTRQMLATADEPAPTLRVTSRNGGILISQEDRTDILVNITLTSRSQERLDNSSVFIGRTSDGVLDIHVDWLDSTWRNGDGAQFDIRIPETNGIEARSSNGRIIITGLSGDLVADTSNGRIEITDFHGPIRAMTSNGRITILNASSTVNAETSNGPVKVSLTEDNAGPVQLGSSNGAITLGIGAGFAGAIEADTSNGSVYFDPLGVGRAPTSVTSGRSHGRATFGNADSPVSTLDTSNGPIRVKNREAVNGEDAS